MPSLATSCSIPQPLLPVTRAAPCPSSVQQRRAGELRDGAGRLRVARVEGESTVVACSSAAPLRLLAPRQRGPSAWVVAASYGGGLVAGDEIALEVEVEEGATALLGTQAETKVYRSRAAPCRLDLRARVGPGGTLVLLPDPVSCFAGARYRQAQRVEIAAGGSLLLLDALVAGRAARGERWAFDEYSGRIEVICGGRLVLADAVRLAAGEGPPVAARMGEIDLVSTLVAVGPRVEGHAAALLARVGQLPADAGADVLVAASPLAGGLHLRLASRGVEAGLARLRALLAFLPEILGDDPYSRRP